MRRKFGTTSVTSPT
ncbi:hypothetical protein D018_4873A, partial [Vibrio parahaemolyticus VP2007-007]